MLFEPQEDNPSVTYDKMHLVYFCVLFK